MIEAIKLSASGEKIGTVQLPDELFNVTCNNPNALLYEVINMYRANQRQGNVTKKSRSDVKGSTRKLFSQKGTGRARMGNIRTPIRRGGGLAFPPQKRDWYTAIPKKKKRLALKIALSKKATLESVFIIENLNFDKPSTKTARELINKIFPPNKISDKNAKGNKLIVISDSDMNVIKSFENLHDVTLDRADRLFAYEVLRSKYIVITEDALNSAQEVFVK